MKGKFFSIFFLAAFGVNSLYSQTPSTLQLDNGCKLFDAVAVNNGLIICTGKEYIFHSNLNWNISNYYPDLSLRYKIPIPKPKLNFGGHLVVSPTGNNVYYLQYKQGGTLSLRSNTPSAPVGSNRQSILHVDSMGASSIFKIKKQFKYEKLNVVFADDHYLYYVTKEKNKNQTRKQWRKHPKPKLQFVRVAHDNAISNVMLELPDPDEDFTEWSYLGHTTEVSYFVCRSVEKSGKVEYRIGVVDEDGKLEDDFKLEAALKAGEIKADFSQPKEDGTLVVDNHNYKVVVSTTTHTYGGAGGSSYGGGYGGGMGHSYTSSSTSYTAYPEAYGDIMFDQQTGGFYIYGLSGPKYEKSKGLFAPKIMPIANGFYVFKFDQDGKKQWDYQGKLSGMNEYFTDKALFIHRKIKLSIGMGGTTRFQAFNRIPARWFTPPSYQANTYEINSETGKYLTGYSNEFENDISPVDLGTCHKSGDKSETGRFLSKRSQGEYSIQAFRVNESNIIIKNLYEDYKLEIYKFDDE